MRFRFAALAGALVTGAVAYSVYWFRLAGEIEHGIARWAEERRVEGVQVEYSNLQVTGFPLRVQAQANDVRLAGGAGDQRWEWKSPQLIGNVLPYRINHIVLSALEPQEITLYQRKAGGEKYWLAPDKALASLVFDAGGLSRLSVDISGGEMNGDPFKGAVRLGRVQLHGRQGNHSIENPPLLELALEIDDLAYPGFAGSALGERLYRLALNLSVEGTAPDAWNADGARQWRDAGGIVQVGDIKILWGPLDIRAAGTLALDEQNRLLGSMTARLKGYEGLINGLLNARQVSEEEAEAARLTLGLISKAAGDGNGELSLPLVLQVGAILLGPVRLAKLKPLF